MPKRNGKAFQLTPDTEEELGTWCRIHPNGELELGWGPATSKHFTDKTQITISGNDCRALVQVLVEHYPLEGLAGIPK